MKSVEELRSQAIQYLAEYYKMFKMKYISEDEWEGRREMTICIFCDGGFDSEARDQFIKELKSAVEALMGKIDE